MAKHSRQDAIDWTKKLRLKTAMSRGKADHVPSLPQIDTQHGIQFTEGDYKEGLIRAYADPWMFLERTISIAERFDYDGIRLGLPGDPVRVRDEHGSLVAYDIENDRRLGVVDIKGGASILPDVPAGLILDEDDLPNTPKSRAEELLSSHPYEMLMNAIDLVKEKLFVVSWALAPTVSYVLLRRGQERGLVDLVENRYLCERIMDLGLELSIEGARALARCGVDALCLGEAYCSCSLISPAIFEHYCVSRLQAFCEEVHKEGVLIYLHVCGNSRPILEMMAETGVDCIEPLDPLGGVDVADAKKRIGGRVALMGGVNTLTLLNGSPHEVREEALNCCRAGGRDGGYIIASGDMIPNFTPPENLQALVQAGKDYRYTT